MNHYVCPQAPSTHLKASNKATLLFIFCMEAAQQEKQGRHSSCLELSQFASELLSGSEVQGGGKDDGRQLGNVMPSTLYILPVVTSLIQTLQFKKLRV